MATIKGTTGNDIPGLFGTADDDLIYGYAGDDHLDGGGGDDTLNGGDGDDFVNDSFGKNRLNGGAGNDDLLGAPSDTLIGGAGDDRFRGGVLLLGGDGADHFEVSGPVAHAAGTRMSGGAGSDTYALSFSGDAGASTPVVTDFAAGPGGDLLDVDNLLAGSSYTGGNPFDSGLGFIALVQSGADTLVVWDHDGLGADPAVTLLKLEDVTATDLTADNIVGAIPPDGGEAPGETLTGGSAADTLIGGFFDDAISGLGGNDRLEGDIGDDSIRGGLGNDVLLGSYGDDTLNGGDGDDAFFVFRNGFLGEQDGRGDDVLIGGAGNDRFADTFGHNTLSGGDGDDVFHAVALGVAGEGSIATGDSGRDTWIMGLRDSGPLNPVATEYVVTDFGPGGDGDILDFGELLVRSASDNSYHGGNPFAAEQGFFRLVQSGDDTLVQWDRDGAGGADYDWATQLTLQGTLAGEITVANIAGGIRPDGTPPAAGETLDVTDAVYGETLSGGYDNDRINGRGGPDFLNGEFGDDTLEGGAGNDFLSGGFGDDSVVGGDGNDQFVGNDQFGGQSHSFGDDRLIGGNGDDTFEDFAGVNVLSGGAGADRFLVASIGGAGNRTTATGGSGRDTYELSSGNFQVATGWTVTDFAAGPAGDLLDLDGLLSFSAGNEGGLYSGGGPFAQGFVRLLQSGADTLVQWDVDGATGPHGWVTQLTLRDVAASSITTDNFTSRIITGTAGDDSLIGGLGNDTVRGLAGNDTLDGSVGSDLLEGGAGADLYFVDSATDVVKETSNTAGALLLPGSSGHGLATAGGAIDSVIAAVNYSLANVQFVENLTLSGSAARATGNVLANRLTGNAGADTLDGGAGNDTLDGGSGSDRLVGGDGNDVLFWGTGDRLSGGAGTDALKVRSGDLDLTALDNTRLPTIETVDLRAGGASALTLTGSDVLALNGAHTLRVLGDAVDVVNAIGFTAHGAAAGGFQKYTSGAATLLIDTDLTVN